MRKRKLRNAAAMILALSMMFPAQAIAAGGGADVTEEITEQGDEGSDLKEGPVTESEDEASGDKEDILKDETETATEEEKTEEDETEEPETSEVTEIGEKSEDEDDGKDSVNDAPESDVNDVEADEEETEYTESDADEADFDDADISTDSDADRDSYNVTYIVSPEELSDKAEVEGDSEVENGKTLKFKVTPEEGYEVEVTANGDILEGHRGMLGLADYYNYRVEDVKDDLEIEITVTGEATEGFFYEESINGVTVTLSAEAGVLPERTTAEIEAVELGTENGISEEELSKYDTVYAFDIKLYDAEGEILPNDWSENGSVKVEFSGEKIKEQAEKSEAADIIHIDSETEEVEIEEKKAEDEIVYEAEHFSVIAVGYVNEVTENVLYVSAKGDDKSGDGSIDNPYATLAGAVNSFDENETDYTIYVMSNIDATSSARFWGKNVTITSYGNEVYTITRQKGFSGTIDTGRGGYNGAILEVQSGSELILKNIILDDAHKREAEFFEEQVTGDGVKENENRVQPAIIEASGDGGGTIILDEGSVLKNFGGMSAVRIGGQFNAGGTYSSLIMKDGSKIIDDDMNEVRDGGFGAVWNQGGLFEMESGASIESINGRAVYSEDGGVNTVDGNISDIMSNETMQHYNYASNGGFGGIALYGESNSILRLGGTISNICTHDNKEIDVAIMIIGSTFEMTKNSSVTHIETIGLVDSNGGKTIISGQVSDCHTRKVFFRLRGTQGTFILKESGKITNSSTTDAGIVYLNGGKPTIEVSGEISGITAGEVFFLSNNGPRPDGTFILTKTGVIKDATGTAVLAGDPSKVKIEGTIKDCSGYAVHYGAVTGSLLTIEEGSVIEGNNRGGAQIYIDKTNYANSDVQHAEIKNGTLIGSQAVNLNLGSQTKLTFDEDYNDIGIGIASKEATNELAELVIFDDRSNWTAASSESIWVNPYSSRIHFTIARPSGAGDTGLYAAYIPLKADGTPADDAEARLNLDYVYNEETIDVTMTELTPGTAYALMFFNSDNYAVSPLDTTIYTGGSSDADSYTDGFPKDEFTGIPDGAVFKVNGQPYDGIPFTISYLLNGQPAANDSEEGIYQAEIIGKDGVNLGDVKIEADGEEKAVDFFDGILTVRYISDKTEAVTDGGLTTELFDNESAALAAVSAEGAEDAVALVEDNEGTNTFTTNGDDLRPITDTEGIALLDDDILSGDDFEDGVSRESLLTERGKRELTERGIVTGADAEKLVYDFHYLDLVDTNNGNAWVASEKGTDVYMPYPEGTDMNTDIHILHYKDLHREYGFEGQAEIDEAIRNSEIEIIGEDVKMEKLAEGIKFHIEEANFSPFVLTWVDDSATTPETPDDGDDGHHSHGGGGGSYTAGINGNWVHVGPVDINAPLSTNVPEGATPVTNPEWHQWKFILNNGTMLYSQWAYIRNPYAVDGQPSEGWFSFDENGIMNYGWYLDESTGKWYYLHRESDGMLGTMETGWHYDGQDGRWYYLNPNGGEMLLGWQQIGESWYYFNPVAPAVTWNYNEATGGWTYNGSESRPYGSMYINETTPDGYAVDENGAWRN